MPPDAHLLTPKQLINHIAVMAMASAALTGGTMSDAEAADYAQALFRSLDGRAISDLQGGSFVELAARVMADIGARYLQSGLMRSLGE